MMKKNLSEILGTFWLVLGGCGTAVLAGQGVGVLGISLAFGLTVLTMAYAVGHISGGHFNPAVTLGLWAGGKFNGKEILPYICSQILGAIAAAAVLFAIVKGGSFEVGGFAANGYGEHSPAGFNMWAAIITEFVMTFMFLLIILGVTDKKASPGFAGLAIGLALALIHFISIPVTNTSVNPARSISQALFAEGGWALEQLWLFIVVPIVGALCAGFVHKFLKSE